MSGHGCFPGDPPFGGVPVFEPGAGVDGLGVVGVVVVGVVGCVVVAAVLVELGEAAAPAMPETAPPTASAPATIVAPSSFDVFIGSNLLVRVGWLCRTIVLHAAKATPRRA
jgi:hypothetical protein